MKLEKHQIFNDFYSLSEMLDDDIDLIVDIIDDVCRVPCIRGRGKGTKATRKKTLTRLYIERADYEKLADDVDKVLSLPMQEFNKIKNKVFDNRFILSKKAKDRKKEREFLYIRRKKWHQEKQKRLKDGRFKNMHVQSTIFDFIGMG